MTAASALRAVVAATAVAAAVLAGSVQAAPPAKFAPPSYFGSDGAPVEEPLQAALGASVDGFTATGGGYDVANAYLQKTSGTPAFNDGDCLAALSAYHSAVDKQRELGHAFEGLQLAYQAMKENERSYISLVVARTTLLATQIAAFAAANEVLQGAAAIVPGTVLSTVNYLAGEIGILGSAYYDNSPPDKVDQRLNSISLVLGNLTAFEHAGHPLASTITNALTVAATAVKAIHDSFDDYAKFVQIADSAAQSYLQAGAQYDSLLQGLESSVTAMKTAMQNCPPKKKKDCGAHNGAHIGSHAACKASGTKP